MGILDGIVEWIAEQIMYVLDLLTTSVISVHRLSQSRATPLPRTFTTPLRKMPEGSRCRANLPNSFTTVWCRDALRLDTQRGTSPPELCQF